MTFETIERLKDSQVQQRYGNYLTTYVSENQQIRADLFVQNGKLAAYIRCDAIDDFDEATDPWLTELQEEARRRGFENRLRRVYVDPRTMVRPCPLP